MFSFSLSSSLWYSVVHSFCIHYVYSLWDSSPGWVLFSRIYLKGLISIFYNGKNWLYNTKIPIIIQRSPHILGHYTLENTSFLETFGLCYTCCYVHPYKLVPALKQFSFFQLNCSAMVFQDL